MVAFLGSLMKFSKRWARLIWFCAFVSSFFLMNYLYFSRDWAEVLPLSVLWVAGAFVGRVVIDSNLSYTTKDVMIFGFLFMQCDLDLWYTRVWCKDDVVLVMATCIVAVLSIACVASDMIDSKRR